MFTGIIETTALVTRWHEDPLQKVIRIDVQRPVTFDHLKIGDSIAVNGVCLTLEYWDQSIMTFCLAHESQMVLGLNQTSWLNSMVNLERSLTLQSRLDGHLVTGHVDAVLKVRHHYFVGESWILQLQLPPEWRPFIWSKGSCALNGVSLTINQVGSDFFQVCLIPETLKRTNLGQLQMGSPVFLEIDNLARGLVYNLQAAHQNPEFAKLWNPT